ncbi:MAG: CDP-alcohol phosphatidyltransferase family protein [Roseiflexaceae bacterium]
MVDKLLRIPKEQALTPVAMHLLRRIRPTTITLFAFSVGGAAALAIWQGYYLLGLVLWLLNRVLDGLDGTLARITDQQSDFGGYLDILLDTVMYAIIPTALAFSVDTPHANQVLILLLISFYVNGASWMYVAALLEKRRAGATASGELTTITMPSGLIEGTETIAFFVLFILFPNAIVALFIVMALLTFATIGQRLIWAARAL